VKFLCSRILFLYAKKTFYVTNPTQFSVAIECQITEYSCNVCACVRYGQLPAGLGFSCGVFVVHVCSGVSQSRHDHISGSLMLYFCVCVCVCVSVR